MSAPPELDTRSYQDLVDEALARIPVHNPEWTNFNRSDPGVTLVELFAFIAESVLYRVNRVPETSRRAFLSLLGIPLQPASSARGIVTLRNVRGEPRTVTLARGLEVRAGAVPFRTDVGVEALPVDGLVYYKRLLPDQPDDVRAFYEQLYASYREGEEVPPDIQLYETVPFAGDENAPVDLVADTVDRSLWIALTLRESVPPAQRDEAMAAIRGELANRTLSIGIVPAPAETEADLRPGGRLAPAQAAELELQVPNVDPSGLLPADDDARVPAYRPLPVRSSVNVLEQPGIVEATLPPAAQLRLWTNVDPIEAGVGDFPPAIEDTKLADRVVTWVRLRAGQGAEARIVWAGINAATVSQRADVAGEVLPDGTGRPDQVVRLARTPVIPDSVSLRVTAPVGTQLVTEEWTRVDDLASAGAEVPVPDLRRPPGARQPAPRPSKVYVLHPDSGEIRFGDGLRGARPQGQIRADYAYGAGRDGNVGAGAISTSPALPAGFAVVNPVRTWGGDEGESVQEGERQVSRYLQHRDRLVAAEDFEAIARRAPGADIGRVEVLPAFSPELPSNAPGDAAGAVTLMLVPRYDAANPNAPLPDQAFLNAVCRYLEPRRLVTTEVFLRPPSYVPIWVSVGIDVEAGRSFAEIRDAVAGALSVYLSPLPRALAIERVRTALGDDTTYPHAERGWPLRKAVVGLELQAVASRVDGVRLVRGLQLGRDAAGAAEVPLQGLELPRLEGIVVSAGDPLSLAQVIDGVQPPDARTPRSFVPVPFIPETC
jgi:predicted phage baseplate assembly protein